MKNDLLFVYGTLLLSDNHFARFLKENSILISKGKIEGRLYDLGNYPGAVLLANSGKYVHGDIVKMNDAAEVLKRLDFYEGIGQSDSEYQRTLVEVNADDGSTMTCWVYLYILSPQSKRIIEHGDYVRYLTGSNRS